MRGKSKTGEKSVRGPLSCVWSNTTNCRVVSISEMGTIDSIERRNYSPTSPFREGIPTTAGGRSSDFRIDQSFALPTELAHEYIRDRLAVDLRFCSRLQRRDRDGITPSSLFSRSCRVFEHDNTSTLNRETSCLNKTDRDASQFRLPAGNLFAMGSAN